MTDVRQRAAVQYRVIDADSHITEPENLWTDRVAAKYRDDVPQVVRDAQGRDTWVVGGAPIGTVGATAPAGWADYPDSKPPTFNDCHPAAFDAPSRLRYLDEQKIWAQVIFPNVAGFGGQQFLAIKDPTIKLECVRAYNDFLHDWCAADSRRLLGVISTPFWDIEETILEIERCAALGLRGVLFTGEPQRFGLPTLGSSHWDPLWSVSQACGLPIHFHIGGGEDRPSFATPERLEAHGEDGTRAYIAADLFMKNGVQVADLITSGVLERFPRLKFVSVESGIGWLPFVLEAVDSSFLGHTYGAHRRHADLLPSDLFRRQVFCTVWFERVALRRLLREIPADNILFETDFPHPACLYGDDLQVTLDDAINELEDQDRTKILWKNAARLYDVQPPPGADRRTL